MNRLLLVALFFCFSTASANHFTGAHLRYEYLGTPLTYRIHLTLYKTCETGAIDFPTFIGIYAESKLNNLVVNKNLPRISNDTLQPFCAGTVTTCTNLSASYPGYITAEYADTIKLPSSANDWYFVFSNSSRNFGITNLQGASGQSFYVDAPLLMANNISAVIPDYPPHTIFINDSMKIPLTALDPDGDSIAYEFVQPASGQGMPIPYYTGYSVATPFGAGGLCYIDGDNNMVLKSTATGKYTLAMKIKEYRNGVYIGYTLRDYIVICVAATPGSTLTTPEPVSTANMVTYTCPGRNNQLYFNFTDGNPADSVYLDIVEPVLPGNWTFTTSTTAGVGTAIGSISWKTPASVTPAQLPFFNVNVVARDNACKLQGKATYVYTVMVRDCSADSVWPGDANSDKTANLYDPLAIAIAYNDTGSARPSASTNWVAQYCDFWDGSFLNNIDKKHADCNGDGIVDTADLNAISLNYGQVHAKGPRRKTTATTELYFDHSGINPNPDSTVNIKILLGNAINPVSGLYGLATNVLVDGLSLATPPLITYSTSWLGNNTNTLSFIKDVSATSVDWAYARTDKQDVNGQGLIANLEFKIPASTPVGTLVTLSFDRAKFIDHEGLELTDIGTLQDTFYVRLPAAVHDINNNTWHAQLYPNPSGKRAELSIHTVTNSDAHIVVCDVTGKKQYEQNIGLNAGKNIIELPAANMPAGVYLLYISAEGNSTRQTLKWIIQ